MSDSQKQQSTQPQNDLGLNFWLKKWESNKINFHRTVVSKLFESHLLPKLTAAEKQKCVVFSLCGKTLDMKAALDCGHQVIGIEGSQSAVEAFFKENNIPYKVEKDEKSQFQIYKGTDHPVTLYCGDFFAFNQSIPPVDYIWDRGGLVAINPSDREQYRNTLYRMMTPGQTELFLVAIHYDDPTFTAPPNNVTDDDVKQLFGSECSTKFLEALDETEEFNSRGPPQPISFIEERIHSITLKKK